VIISANVVRTRKPRRCWNCSHLITTLAIRLYGHAEDGNPPYVVWSHPECVSDVNNPKIAKVLEAVRAAGGAE
jgi:hypothetical protein